MKIKLFLTMITLIIVSCQNDVFHSKTKTAPNDQRTIALGDYSAGGYIYISTDGGVTWQQKGTPSQWSAIATSGDGTKLVAAVQGIPSDIYTSNDSGNTWVANNVDLSNNHYWSGIAMSADGTNLFTTDYYVSNATYTPPSTGYIFASTDGGATWTSDATLLSTYGARYITQIATSSDGSRVAVVHPGMSGMYVYIYNGSSWSTSAAVDAASHQFSCIASSSDGRNLAVGAITNYIYTSTDYGASWTQRTGTGTGYWVSIAS
jgi:photosystem II stability/assembly factor-like uncharacterized protein